MAEQPFPGNPMGIIADFHTGKQYVVCHDGSVFIMHMKKWHAKDPVPGSVADLEDKGDKQK